MPIHPCPNIPYYVPWKPSYVYTKKTEIVFVNLNPWQLKSIKLKPIKERNYVLQTSFFGTALIKNICQNSNRRAYVCTPYPMLFHNNPYVLDTTRFLKKYLQFREEKANQNDAIKTYETNPWNNYWWHATKQHIMQSWCLASRVRYKHVVPEFYKKIRTNTGAEGKIVIQLNNKEIQNYLLENIPNSIGITSQICIKNMNACRMAKVVISDDFSSFFMFNNNSIAFWHHMPWQRLAINTHKNYWVEGEMNKESLRRIVEYELQTM